MSRKPEKVTRLEIKVNVLKLPKGHTPHRSGAGKHDSTTNRERTRQNKNKKAIEDSNG